MARKELRHCTVRVKDGLAGTAAINQMSPMAGATTLMIDTIALNSQDPQLVPVGARFTVAGETLATQIHTVTARTPSAMSPTTQITFTPALGAGTYMDNGVLTFTNQQIDIKIGDGDIKWTEKNEYNYDLDRGELDTVREGNDVPMDVSLNFTFEHVKSGTGEAITPMEAIKGVGAASEWVSSATDKCEPYAVDIEVEDNPPCGTAQKETFVWPDFRSENREGSFKDSNVSVTGRCNATEPIVTRG